jgi:hypothetical protein
MKVAWVEDSIFFQSDDISGETHLMKQLTIPGEYTQMIVEYLSRNYSKVTRKTWRTDQQTIALFIHEEYVFRTSSYQTLTTIVESTGDFGNCTVTAIGSGGGGGLFNISWGSQDAGETTIIKNIEKMINNMVRQQ